MWDRKQISGGINLEWSSWWNLHQDKGNLYIRLHKNKEVLTCPSELLYEVESVSSKTGWEISQKHEMLQSQWTEEEHLCFTVCICTDCHTHRLLCRGLWESSQHSLLWCYWADWKSVGDRTQCSRSSSSYNVTRFKANFSLKHDRNLCCYVWRIYRFVAIQQVAWSWMMKCF